MALHNFWWGFLSIVLPLTNHSGIHTERMNFDLSGENLDLLDDDFFDEFLLNATQPSATQLLNISTQQLVDSKQKPSSHVDNDRFDNPLSADDIKFRNAMAVPKKTRQANGWSLGIWKEWAKLRNSLDKTRKDIGYPIPEDVGLLDNAMLDYWGQRFILEIRRKDGQPYPPNTLIQIVSGIQRYLRSECGRPDINVLKPDSVAFSGFRTALDTRMKELHAQGIGVSKHSSEPVTPNDELKLWDTGVFNLESAEGISNAVFFYNGKLFGFRGYQEHVDAQADQFEICTNPENGLRYIKYTPRLRKNSQGGLKNRRLALDPIVHYEQKDRDVSVVEMYSKYLLLIPRVGPFYRKPLPGLDENGNFKFSCGTISQGSIKNMLKRFFSEAGIDVRGRKITNHSARVTMCTALYNNKFSDKAVMSRSKHTSTAVHAYQREQFQILNEINNCLEPDIRVNTKPLTSETTSVKPDTTSVKPETTSELSPIESEPVQNSVPSSTLDQSMKDRQNPDETLTIYVPNCVKKMIIVKTDGKRMVIDV